MYNKTFWIGWIVVFVVMQALGYLVHEVLLSETYEGLMEAFRPEAEMRSMMWMMMVGSLVYLFLFCVIFTKGREGKGVSEGVRYGLLIGLLMSIPMSVDQYVVYPLTATLAASWFVSGVLMFTIAGAIFAAIYKPGS